MSHVLWATGSTRYVPKNTQPENLEEWKTRPTFSVLLNVLRTQPKGSLLPHFRVKFDQTQGHNSVQGATNAISSVLIVFCVLTMPYGQSV